MNSAAIKDLIYVLLDQTDGGMDAESIHNALDGRNGFDITKRRMKSLLKEMYEEDIIRRDNVSDGTRGRPPYIYYVDESEDTDLEIVPESVRVRGELTIDSVEGLPEGIYWDIVEKQLDSSQVVESIKEAAPEIAELDPVDTLLEMLDWTVNRLNELGEELANLQEEGKVREFRNVRDRYDNLHYWAEGYFHRFWRLHRFEDPGADHLHLPDHDDFLEARRNEDELPQAAFTRESARKQFESRAFGDSLISKCRIDEDAKDAVGTDSSYAEVSLPNRSRLAPETTFQLFAGAAALKHEDRKFTDFDFNPQSLRDIRRRQSFTKGLLVSPEAQPQLGEGELEKSRYAAMELRLYKECNRVIDGDADWVPYGTTTGELSDYTGPDVMFLDGRVTPLVHQISDFVADGLYGELCRREIREFGKLTDYASEENWHTDTTFAGVVKRPAISWFSPIVFWYLETEYWDDNGKATEYVHSPPISDVILPHILFLGLTEANEPPSQDEIYTTFRVLRRFYDHSIEEYDLPPVGTDDELIDIDDREEWMSCFSAIQDRKEEFGAETMDLANFKEFRFADLCANVGTLMCYAGPPNLYQDQTREGIRLPRMEILTNPPGDAESRMIRALSIYAKTNYPDEDHAEGGFSTMNDVEVIVPEVIVDADDVAKEVRDFMREDVERDLLEVVRQLQQSR